MPYKMVDIEPSCRRTTSELQNEGGIQHFGKLKTPPRRGLMVAGQSVLRAQSYDLFYSKAECTKKTIIFWPDFLGGFLTQHSRDKWGEPPTPLPKSWISMIGSLLPENRLQCFQTFLPPQESCFSTIDKAPTIGKHCFQTLQPHRTTSPARLMYES